MLDSQELQGQKVSMVVQVLQVNQVNEVPLDKRESLEFPVFQDEEGKTAHPAFQVLKVKQEWDNQDFLGCQALKENPAFRVFLDLKGCKVYLVIPQLWN